MRKLLLAFGLAALMVGTVVGCGEKKPTTSPPPTDTKPGREPDLIKPRLTVIRVQIGKHSVLQRRELCFSERIGNHGDTDLIEAPRQRHRDAANGDRDFAWQRANHENGW